MSVQLLGGPFSGETIEWDTEHDVALVERDNEWNGQDRPELRLTRETLGAWYVRINAGEAIYQGAEAPDPSGSA